MKLVTLLSSGIDSPVATYLLSKKVTDIIFLHVDIKPFTDEKEKENFLKIAKKLKEIIGSNVKTYIVSHGENLDKFIRKCDKKYTCIFCKRMMLRYAEKIAEKENAMAIIMGDSLGQVASQTLDNLNVIDKAINIAVLRPLIGFDKQEIIKISKRISFYDLSILPSKQCTAVPNKPSTSAKIEKILLEEKKLEIKKLVEKTVKDAKIVKI